MTKPIVYYWAPSDGEGFNDGIALEQAVAAGDQVVLVNNTTASNPGVFSYVNMLTPNTTMNGLSTDIIRSINISSPADIDDNSGTTFVISGIGTPIDGNGNPIQVIGPITENLVGPAGGLTVTSVNIYTVINSITATVADAPGFSIGYGPNGITNYYFTDTNRNVPSIYGLNYSIQVIDPVDTMEIAVYNSLNKPEVPGIYGGLQPFGLVNGVPVAFIPAFALTVSDDFNTLNFVVVPGVIWSQVSLTTTGSMFFTVVQQGI